MRNFILLFGFNVLIISCVTGEKREKKDTPNESGHGDSDKSSQQQDDFDLNDNLVNFTVSVSNNPLTSRRFDRREAAGLAAKLEGMIQASKGDDRKAMVSLMSLRRMSGSGIGPVIEIARQIVAQEMKKDINKGLPEFAKIELMLAAVQSKKFSLAEFFIDELSTSKNKRVKAIAFTAAGLIAAQDDRLPEAVESWSKALEEVPDFDAAALNLGFYAAKFGDFPRAKKLLGGMQGDWFAAYGLITAERMTKDADKAEALCKKVLAAEPRHKPALFNCGLNAGEGKKDFEQALALMDRATKISGLTAIDDKAISIKNEFEKSAAQQRSPSKK